MSPVDLLKSNLHVTFTTVEKKNSLVEKILVKRTLKRMVDIGYLLYQVHLQCAGYVWSLSGQVEPPFFFESSNQASHFPHMPSLLNVLLASVMGAHLQTCRA